MKHETVIKNFVSRKINKVWDEVRWTGHNVYCRGNVLYSYGSHFPLAKHLGRWKLSPDSAVGPGNVFIKNIDKFSCSTSRHQSLVKKHCYGPMFSSKSLDMLGIDFLKLEQKNIIHHRAYYRNWVYRDKLTGKFYENMVQNKNHNHMFLAQSPWYTGMINAFEEEQFEDNPEWTPLDIGYFSLSANYGRIEGGTWNIDGATVLYVARKYYLCFNDMKNGKHKVEILADEPYNVDDAFNMLKKRKR